MNLENLVNTPYPTQIPGGMMLLHSTISASTNYLPRTVWLTAGALPPGMTLESAGHLRETQPRQATIPSRSRFRDAANNTDTRTCTLRI